MDNKIIEVHQEYKDSKLVKLIVLWEANESGAVRGTYCDDVPKGGYEYLKPTDIISPELIQKVAGYGMDIPEQYKHYYFAAHTNWDR